MKTAAADCTVNDSCTEVLASTEPSPVQVTVTNLSCVTACALNVSPVVCVPALVLVLVRVPELETVSDAVSELVHVTVHELAGALLKLGYRVRVLPALTVVGAMLLVDTAAVPAAAL